jgi:lipopolysaccharide biosynthesis regulator YciM
VALVDGGVDPAARTRRALQALLEGDYDGAERELAEVVRADSSDVVAYLALAHLYRARGEIGRALRVHQNLLLRSDLAAKQRGQVLLALAADLRAGGYRERAIAAYQEVLEANPGRSDAVDALVELFAQSGQQERAIAVLKRSAGWLRRIDARRESRLLTEMARGQAERGLSEVARKALKRAIKRDPLAAAPRILLGDLDAERLRDKAALAAWCDAVECEPEDPDALWERIAATYSSLGRSDEFEPFARARLDRAPGDRAATRALARTLAARGEVDSALRELRGLLDADPADAQTRGQLGRLLLAEKRQTDALKAYEEWIEVVAPIQPVKAPGEDSA